MKLSLHDFSGFGEFDNKLTLVVKSLDDLVAPDLDAGWNDLDA
jgi:hypothetical protein